MEREEGTRGAVDEAVGGPCLWSRIGIWPLINQENMGGRHGAGVWGCQGAGPAGLIVNGTGARPGQPLSRTTPALETD